MVAEGASAGASSRYGSRAGFAIFHWMIRRLGVRPAYFALVFVTLYYWARPSARKTASYYLARRFPERGRLWRFFATYVHIYRFGQIMIEQAVMGILGRDAFRIAFEAKDDLRQRANSGRGVVLLTTHAGPWQAAMANIGGLGVPVSFLFRREPGMEGHHFFDLAGKEADFRIISPDGFLGGTIELTNALEDGECIATMGDRAPGGGATCKAPFLGADAAFPVTPYRLAVATGADLVVLLTARTGKLTYRMEAHLLTEGVELSGMKKRAATELLLSRYVAVLERYVENYPFMWFNFFDFWAEPAGADGSPRED